MHQRPDVDLMGVSIKAWTEEQCIRQITNDWRAGKGGWIHTVNIDILRQLAENPKLAQLCKGVDYSVADGMPLVWASALKGEALPERITGSHLIQTLSAAAGADGKTVFMLGGQPGVAEKAGAVLMRQSPGLTIVGYCCPPFGFEQDPYEVQAIIEQVIEAKPDLLFLALTPPKAEYLISLLKPLLPQTWFMGVGISFSFLTGDVPRAPQWMQKTGLEWLFRLGAEPTRLFSRYIIKDIPFAFRLLYSSLKSRRARQMAGEP